MTLLSHILRFLIKTVVPLLAHISAVFQMTFFVYVPWWASWAHCWQHNLYAAQQGSPITFFRDDILGFLGLNVAMGLPEVKDYWAHEPILRHPWFSTVIPRDKFLAFLNFSILQITCRPHTVAVVTIDCGKFVLSSKLSKNNCLKPTF